MSKVTMPEPVAKQIRHYNANMLASTYGQWTGWSIFNGKHERAGGYQKRDLITTDQAEAYADARVREALECVSREVHNVLHPTNPREDWTQYAYIREEAAHDAESAIRALIPKEQEA